MTAPRTPSRGERVEGLVLVLILLTVAGFAGAASFTHVKTWTLDNSPAGTREWFGWANAVISELVPTACALVIRRRRRLGVGIGYPMFLLMAAVALSLAAQFAVAKPSVSGWLLSAVPAVAFVALTKLVLSTTPPAREPDPVMPAPEVPERGRASEDVDPPGVGSSSTVMVPPPVLVDRAVMPARVNGHVIASEVIR